MNIITQFWNWCYLAALLTAIACKFFQVEVGVGLLPLRFPEALLDFATSRVEFKLHKILLADRDTPDISIVTGVVVYCD